MSETNTDLSIEDRIGVYFTQPNALYRESPHELLRLAMYELGNKDRQIESLEIFRRDAKVENAELHSKIISLELARDEARAEAEKWLERLEDIQPNLVRALPWEGGDE